MFTTFDIIVFVIVGFSTLFAFLNGFLREILSFLAWIGSIFIAIFLFPHTTTLLSAYIANKILLYSICSIGVYITSLTIISIINSRLIAVISRLKIGGIDKLLGLLFGFLRGSIIVALIFLSILVLYPVFTQTDKNANAMPDWLKQAKTYPYLKVSAELTMNLIPDDFIKMMTDSVNSLSQSAANVENTLSKKSITPTALDVKTLNQMIKGLPKTELDKLGIDGTKLPEILNSPEMLENVISAYNANASGEKIPSENIEALKGFLQQRKSVEIAPDANQGYNQNQRNDMQRIIDQTK